MRTAGSSISARRKRCGRGCSVISAPAVAIPRQGTSCRHAGHHLGACTQRVCRPASGVGVDSGLAAALQYPRAAASPSPYLRLPRPPSGALCVSEPASPSGLSACSGRCRQAGEPEKLSITAMIGSGSGTVPRRRPCTLRMAPSFSRPCERRAASVTRSARAWAPARRLFAEEVL